MRFISGHTHAGQIPIMVPVMYVTMPFFHGLYRYEPTDTTIYVSSGLYFVGPPMKMPFLSQVVMVVLKVDSGPA